MLRVALVFFVFLSAAVQAQTLGASAYREPGTDYRGYKAAAAVFSFRGLETPDRITPMQAAKKNKTVADLPKATEWESVAKMSERFEQFRDLRFMNTPSKPNFPRRSSWLYPDDGCFARAALAVGNLVQMKVTAPNKVFAFGDLVVNTVNSPNGQVTWWYHVAPIVEVSGQKYVLDPAIEPEHPLKLEEWLQKMSSKPQDIEVSICESGAYTPGDDCSKVTDGVEEGAHQDQVYYLDAEWERLVDLQRKPEQELGDFPPWIH